MKNTSSHFPWKLKKIPCISTTGIKQDTDHTPSRESFQSSIPSEWKSRAFYGDSFGNTFLPNPSPNLPEIFSTLFNIKTTTINICKIFTFLENIQKIILKPPKKKSSDENSIINTVLKYIPLEHSPGTYKNY